VGLNNFKYIHLRNADPQSLKTVDHAHSLFFNALAQTGFLGFGGLLLFLGATAGEIARKLKSVKDPTRSLYLEAAAAGWLVIVLVGFSNTTLHHEIAMIFFLLMSVLRKDNDENQNNIATEQIRELRT
jgi:O-antigen ligase